MDSDDESSKTLMAPRPPLCLPVFPQKIKIHQQVLYAGLDNLVPDIPAKADHLFSFSDALVTNVARLNVNNMSLDRQAFILFPSAPTLFGMSPAPESLRFGIFQSSKLVDKLSEGSNFGSVTFKLPFDKPLNWANKNASPGIIVITGTESTEDDPKGVGEFAPTPEITHWTLLSSGKTDGHPARNSCVMSVAKGEEPRFLNSSEMAEGNYTEFKDLKPGTIVIKTDDLVGRDNDARPFVGIGAINPRFRHIITPIMTWVVQPNTKYQIAPNMTTWQLASGTPREPGTIIDPKLLSNSFKVTFQVPPSQPTNFSLDPNNLFSIT